MINLDMSYHTRLLNYVRDREFLTKMIKDNLSRSIHADKTVDWSYENNPCQNACGHILEYTDGQHQNDNVGVLSIAYRDFYFNQKKLRAALCGDFVVTAGHRSLQPALKLIKDSVQSELDSCLFVYGFPNEKALGVLKMSGFKAVGKLTRYACVLKTGRYMRQKIKNLVIAGFISNLIDLIRCPLVHFQDVVRTKNIKITETFNFATDVDKISKNSAINHLIFNCRSSLYLNWRYFAKPDNAYVGLVCSRFNGTQLVSYAVLEHEHKSNTIHVRDMLFSCNRALVQLLSAIRIWAYKHNADSISMSILAPDDIAELIMYAGFSPRESVRNVLVKTNDSNILQILLNKNSWFLLDGDEDQ